MLTPNASAQPRRLPTGRRRPDPAWAAPGGGPRRAYPNYGLAARDRGLPPGSSLVVELRLQLVHLGFHCRLVALVRPTDELVARLVLALRWASSAAAIGTRFGWVRGMTTHPSATASSRAG